MVFQHSPVKAWRFDRGQEQRRGRGKGELTIHYDCVKGLAKIIFNDKLSKRNMWNSNGDTRLLQYINGASHCDTNMEQFPKQRDHYNHYDDTKRVTWYGTDYSLKGTDMTDGMSDQWILSFYDDLEARDKFIKIFNFYIDTPNKTFTLKDIKKISQSVKDIVNGYIKRIDHALFEQEKKSYNIPILLNYLCLMYYHDPWLNPDQQ